MLEFFASKTRDKPAALKVIKKLMKRHGPAKAVTTDGLRSDKAALTEFGNADKQEVARWAHNRCENSHLPFRRRERAKLRFRQKTTLQKFSCVHAAFHNDFNQDRHLISRRHTEPNAQPPWRVDDAGRIGSAPLPSEGSVEANRGRTDSTPPAPNGDHLRVT